MPNALTFSGDDSAPTGPAFPNPREVQAVGVLGLDLGRQGRVALMNQIGGFLGVPPGGWHGQARLFKGDDLRLVDLLGAMAKERTARLMAANLERAARYVQVNLMLAMVTAQREASRSLTATGRNPINTYHQGGLDFLDLQKRSLGLPGAITKGWTPAPSFLNGESNNYVHPERIPAQDQVLAYAATIAASFNHNFRASVRDEFGDPANVAFARASRFALIVWQAYAFVAPGGAHYDPLKPVRSQLGQKFGHRSALGYYAYRAKSEGRMPSLDDILTDHALDHLEWLRSAKTRAAETLFMERLLKCARELIVDRLP